VSLFNGSIRQPLQLSVQISPFKSAPRYSILPKVWIALVFIFKQSLLILLVFLPSPLSLMYICLYQFVEKIMQRNLNLFKGRHGGRRPGSGRPRQRSPGVSHRSREVVSAKTPLHVNFKYKAFIRNKDSLKLLKKAIQNARSHGLKVLHYPIEANHIHLILEAKSNALLSKGMRSLTITMAKGPGLERVQVERYHLHVLRSIREVKNSIDYVLFNKQRHEKRKYSTIDQYSSLLLMENALTLIKKFSHENKVTLKIEKGEAFYLDKEESFLAQRGWSELYC
jgi:hypothetical protein